MKGIAKLWINVTHKILKKLNLVLNAEIVIPNAKNYGYCLHVRGRWVPAVAWALGAVLIIIIGIDYVIYLMVTPTMMFSLYIKFLNYYTDWVQVKHPRVIDTESLL